MFKWKLSQCLNIVEVCQLIRQNSEIKTDLVKELCSETMKLICNYSFKQLSLNNNVIVTFDTITDEVVVDIFYN